ncbi:MAG: hypothetical protein RR327_02120, partial [Clostridia bacterium]
IIIPLLNDIRLQRKFRAKIIGSYAVNVAIVAVFFVVIIGVFGVLAPRQLFFISKISRYSVTFSSVGRVDFIFLCALILGMILWCAVIFMLGIKCLSIATGIKRAYLTVPIVVASFAFLMLSHHKISQTMEFVIQFVSYFAILMQYVVPIFIMIMFKSLQKRGLNYG